MTTRDDFRFQPGWAMPVAIDHRKPGFVAWFLSFARAQPDDCLARRQGRCPGPGQCHDCAWSPQDR